LAADRLRSKILRRRGEADAVTNIAKYESWGGAKDGAWHGPATAIYLLVSTAAKTKSHALAKRRFHHAAPTPVRERTFFEHSLGRTCGRQSRLALQPRRRISGRQRIALRGEGRTGPGQASLQLAGDFTGGGAYVAAIKSLAELEAKEIPRFACK